MAEKKKRIAGVVVVPPPVLRMPVYVETVPCPAHGFMLELKEQDGKLVAICDCDVKPNKHAGQTVYERSIDKE